MSKSRLQKVFEEEWDYLTCLSGIDQCVLLLPPRHHQQQCAITLIFEKRYPGLPRVHAFFHGIASHPYPIERQPASVQEGRAELTQSTYPTQIQAKFLVNCLRVRELHMWPGSRIWIRHLRALIRPVRFFERKRNYCRHLYGLLLSKRRVVTTISMISQILGDFTRFKKNIGLQFALLKF